MHIIIIFNFSLLFTKCHICKQDVNRYMWPFQHSIIPRKELKELLQMLGFTIIHCSHRETYFFNQDSNKFLCKSL